MQKDSNSVLDDLDREYAPAWKPDAGDKIVGIVSEISEREGTYGVYPIVTLRTEDGELAVHAFHEVLQNELARLAPKQGDLLGIKYAGMDSDKGYHRYRVRRGGAEAGGVEWSRYGSDVDGELADDGATQEALDVERAERDAAASVHEPLE